MFNQPASHPGVDSSRRPGAPSWFQISDVAFEANQLLSGARWLELPLTGIAVSWPDDHVRVCIYRTALARLPARWRPERRWQRSAAGR